MRQVLRKNRLHITAAEHVIQRAMMQKLDQIARITALFFHIITLFQPGKQGDVLSRPADAGYYSPDGNA
ncbi:hypothetical protein SDC9_161178 [bioreactor metagenome]|uniref:Uncharacterized protein n=1 Tax=bioreactor metagenome TaxID=1076179 RepID=A0A645FJX5_9ZZZZ